MGNVTKLNTLNNEKAAGENKEQMIKAVRFEPVINNDGTTATCGEIAFVDVYDANDNRVGMMARLAVDNKFASILDSNEDLAAEFITCSDMISGLVAKVMAKLPEDVNEDVIEEQ